MKNERGIALVMVLIFSLIALAIVSALLFMITQGTQLSGGQRFYKTAEEASLGGTEIAMAFIMNRGIAPALPGILTGTGAGTSSAACMTQKLTLSRAAWAGCAAADMTLDAAINSDMRFDLGPFRVFTKIVDTVEGNSDVAGLVTGGGELGGAGVVAANSGMVSPPHIPYLYRMEVEATASANAREKSRLSVLYAY
jgi:hypothetical protein